MSTQITNPFELVCRYSKRRKLIRNIESVLRCPTSSVYQNKRFSCSYTVIPWKLARLCLLTEYSALFHYIRLIYFLVNLKITKSTQTPEFKRLNIGSHHLYQKVILLSSLGQEVLVLQ